MCSVVVGPILARRAAVREPESGEVVLGMFSWESAIGITISEVDGENIISQIGCWEAVYYGEITAFPFDDIGTPERIVDIVLLRSASRPSRFPVSYTCVGVVFNPPSAKVTGTVSRFLSPVKYRRGRDVS